MPQGGLPVACPQGSGDGVYCPLKPVEAVVAVVGTAHVHGIVSNWGSADVTQGPQEAVIANLLSD